MQYLIYHKETTIILRKWAYGKSYYMSEAAAKAGLTRFVKNSLRNQPINPLRRADYAIAEVNHFFQKIEKQETKRNLLSGKEFTQGVNTPASCDPSTETYHSM